MHLDQTDKGILDELQSNARITNAALAKRVNLSPSSTLERVKKLEASGLIERYVTLLNSQKAGYTCMTFVEVTLARHGETPVDDFFKAIADMDEVLECHHITGEGDFLLKIATRDIPHYDELILHGLSALTNVEHLKTSVVLSTFKHQTRLPI
ncbi:MAG: Lrp/AsnC family transcriptional regulator [Candidatus Marinimicrobia bacterium]|jgi:DNA-binding Lrp family transcriptional regulator|nr:Lrp/AsnC family transcriptional regulator [Candidatus Neomarinimicrobiota bacterium]MBT3676039.1 Lrp/AsnC family transcriptional regulator [Candidatus Neomarinimicrobiota bacterium]MBT3762418.1 Lrp/AsnC family transcriptional regulator [Candidatus Neomarinimicrobiota bacterium]MBT4067503.1 Lrp/AsnC family transcriptional regulator [Candidatus Neomarinimicrobiota bacterium]MBT4271690.1 Lrp/AsnC family transcriptional regulator [Candidatus Neomarinimicrobiota bacterium]